MKSIALSRQWLFFGVVLFVAALIQNHGNSIDARSTPSVSIPEAIAMVDAGALVVDVRERSTAAGSHLPGALLIPLEVVAAQLGKMEIAKTQPIVVYCGNGASTGPAAVKALHAAGFTNVVNLEAGIEGWRTARLPTAQG
jgi:rhodanese-related sulfurtransferase